MPLLLETRRPGRRSGTSDFPRDAERRRPETQWQPALEIGLVNNMPDAALRATEKQFIDLLGAATGERIVRLHLFSLPGVARGSAARAHIGSAYGEIHSLKAGRLDALIVTGAEPVAPALSDEPYWQDMTDLADWAESHTVSTIWSCLAAHAAVLHFDGIGRHRLADKRFGMFDCDKVFDSPLLEGLPAEFKAPHSRWNDLKEQDLRAHGYRVLTRSTEAGVDLFSKQWGSLFVFFQGHPEYAADTLFREYRRDVTRYLRGERDTVPALPRDYFDVRTEATLERMAARAERHRGPDAQVRMPNDWALRRDAIEVSRSGAVRIYRNWLDHIAAVKAK